MSILFIKKESLDIATVFTTHATILGRHLCAGDVDFYNNIKNVDIDFEAGKRGIYTNYCLERAITHCADVFTCVSHITAFEAECLLHRKPDGVLPNGINSKRSPTFHDVKEKYEKNRKRILEFITGHFNGHINFDLEQTIVVFIAGRREFRNKGVDLFIECLRSTLFGLS